MRNASRVAALAAGLLGAASLASWAVDVPWLRGGRIQVQPNAAVALVLASAALLLVHRESALARRAAGALAVIVLAVGLATTLEHLLGVDFGIDRFIYPLPYPTPASTSPGRMGPHAASSLTLAGLAILLLLSPARRLRSAAQGIALAAAPFAMISLVGYAYDVALLYDASALSAIAFPAALALLFLEIAILLARPEVGLVAHFTAAGTGTALARRVAVYAVCLPFAIGWLALAASQADADGAVAVTIVVVALTLVLVLLLLRDAVAVELAERARERAQADEEASRRELAVALRREQEARVAAEAASKARDEFISTLSHELRTPLNAILGWNRLLRDGPADPDRLGRGLAVVERNGRALAQVVSDLLDMSRIVRGSIQLERVELDVAAAAGAAVEAVRPAAEAKGIALSLAVEPGVPLVMGDPARVQQIAWNLLSNAVKFTPAAGHVAVRLGADGGRAVLSVEDDGPGIDPAFLPHVFERFRQADGSSARRHGGLGLGLALTRELVGLHSGTIEAASAGPGRGATFRVVLPAAPAVPAAPPRRERAHLGGARVLVVDDEADSRELLLQLLAAWGARPAGAASAREAIAAAACERPDLVLSDIAMPGEDGCAMMQELRRAERAAGQPPVPAVALTAFTRPDDRRRVLAAGFDAHVGKPVEPDELRETLAGLLRREPTPAARVPEAPRTPAATAQRDGSPTAAPAGAWATAR